MRLLKECAELKDLRMQKQQKFHIEIANVCMHITVAAATNTTLFKATTMATKKNE